MARIYLNLPCLNSNGNSIYTMWRWIIFALVLITGFILLYLSNIFDLSKSEVFDNLQEIHYGIVIDCGSSGSRVFVYYWPTHSGNPKDLLNIQQLLDKSGNAIVKKVSPGLSSFEKDPDSASDHIKELLLYAQKYIPKKKHPETFLYVMATAGMRMLSTDAQEAILHDLRNDIKKDFSFIAPETNFEVISGKQEGVFAWIAINYVLDRFSHSSSESDQDLATVSVQHSGSGEDDTQITHVRKRTVGIIDMGGGSVQIAFEVTDPNQMKEIPAGLLSEFNLGCKDSDLEHSYRVYVTTFLGYGANSARDRYEEMLIKRASAQEGGTQKPIVDVCLPSGMQHTSKEETGVSHTFIGGGDYDACTTALEPLLNRTVACSKDPCSLNGIHQPHIDSTNQFFGFSEFWYSTEDVFRMGGHYSYTNFHSKAKEFCGTNWDTLSKWYAKNLYPKADVHRFKFQCFKSAWMTQVFHKGFSFSHDYNKFVSAQLVKNKDVGWTLGALIYKTRFLPLRDVERLNEQQQTQMSSHWQRASRILDTQFLLLACFLVVLAAIFVYMQRLKCCPRKADLSRVPSMSYFMTEQDQMEQGVKYIKGQGYIL